jgi:hypothetical protein
MARSLRGLGIILLAVAVWLFIAGAAGWAAEDSVASIGRKVALAGLAALGAGITLGFLGRMSRPIQRGRCARCGSRIERGQTYCMDHLLETVTEAREHTRGNAPVSRPARRS